HSGTPLLDAAVPSDLQLPGSGPVSPPGARAPAHPWLVVDVKPATVQLDARELAEGVGFTGTLRNPRSIEVSLGDTVGVRGPVELDSHSVEILGRRYNVEPTRNGPSGLLFDGTIDPRIDIRLVYQFPQLTLNVDLTGRLSRPDRPMFSSDPAGDYTQDQLFGFF